VCLGAATDTRGRLPYPYGHRQNNTNTGYPSFIDGMNNTTEQQVKRYGTSWRHLQPYGLQEAVTWCPSATWPTWPTKTVWHLDTNSAEWGVRVVTTYLFLPNLQERLKNLGGWHSYAGWTSKGRPGETLRDPDLPHRLLAADTVYWGGGPEWPWGDGRRINHADNGGRTPAWQSLLRVDGSASGAAGTYRAKDLNTENPSANNWSFKHAINGAFYYWQGATP
jgi:hypothetical protein